MTKKEFERIGKELASQLPNCEVQGQLIFLRPLDHILRGVFFDRSIVERAFHVQIFLQPLFVQATGIYFNFGWRLGNGSTLWQGDDPDIIEKLSAALKRTAMPFLRQIQTPQDLADATNASNKWADAVVQKVGAYAYARAGLVEKAIEKFDRVIELMDNGYWKEEIERLRALKSQLLTNPSAVQKQFDKWEVETVKNLGLEKFR